MTSHLSKHGSQSSSMGQLLNDTLLSGWEDLLKMDPSATVQISVLKCLGTVASELGWVHSSSHDATQLNTTTLEQLDVTAMVEAQVLTMFLIGLSVGNVTQVRTLAVQQLCSLQGRNENDESADAANYQTLPRDKLVAYFQPMLELILASCTQGWTPCQSKVRSLKTLQVLLCLGVSLTEANTACTPTLTSSTMVHSIIGVLSKNMLSEDKEVLEAASVCCRIIGCNNQVSKAVVEDIVLPLTRETRDVMNAVLGEGDADSLEGLQSSANHLKSSPRQMTSILLVLDSMMKGSLCNKYASNMLNDIDSSLAIQSPNWFSSSTATTMSSLLCYETIINNVATNSSLAWALLDVCNSFAQCCASAKNSADDTKLELAEEVIINVLVCITYLISCPDEVGLSSQAICILTSFSAIGSNAKSHPISEDEEKSSFMDDYFRRVLPRILSSAPPFPWKQTDPAFLAMDALLRVCNGSTIGGNFDMVAPFFISHLSTSAYNKNCGGNENVLGHGSKTGATSKDEVAEEYSLRISLMALLQTILSAEGFSQMLSPGGNHDASATASFSSQFTTDVMLSLVLPNLVWKAGGMASALRKLAAATLFSLLTSMTAQDGNNSAQLHPDMISHLVPVLHSNLEDTESTTRELSCVCLSLVFEQMSAGTFNAMWETNTRAIDTLYPRLLELFDDSHDPVRMSACNTLTEFIRLAHDAALEVTSPSSLGLSSLENITSSLLIQLDDPDKEMQDSVYQVIFSLIELQYKAIDQKGREKSQEVVSMIKRQINIAMKSHRNVSYCQELLDKINDFEKTCDM